MKNFARALRHAWPYRGRLAVSIVAAFLAAIIWGGNFTSVYPVLKLLTTKVSLHVWIDETIGSYQKESDRLAAVSDRLGEDEKALEKLPSDRGVEKRKRAVAAE